MTAHNYLFQTLSVRSRQSTLAVEAFVYLLYAWWLCRFRSLKQVIDRLDSDLLSTEPHPAGPDRSQDRIWVGLAVRRVAAMIPIRSECLQQSIAARLMYERRGIHSTMSFGVRYSDDGQPSYHSWLSVNGHVAVGGPRISLHQVLLTL